MTVLQFQELNLFSKIEKSDASVCDINCLLVYRHSAKFRSQKKLSWFCATKTMCF